MWKLLTSPGRPSTDPSFSSSLGFLSTLESVAFGRPGSSATSMTQVTEDQPSQGLLAYTELLPDELLRPYELTCT